MKFLRPHSGLLILCALCYPTLASTSVQEVRVNTFRHSSQDHASLDVLSNNEFVVVWDSRRQQHGTYGVYLQRYAATGQRLGDETPVNLTTDSMQVKPAIAADGAGGAWVVWESFGQDGDGNGIIGRYLKPGMADAGDEILMNQVTSGNQQDVVIIANEKGRAFCAWCTSIPNESRLQVVGRLVDTTGRFITDEFVIAESRETLGALPLPTLIHLQSGNIGIVWSSTDSFGNPSGLYYRVYDWNGCPVGGEIPLVSEVAIEPAALCTFDGRLLVAWLEPELGEYAAFYSYYSETGKSLSPIMRISPLGGTGVSGITLAESPDYELMAIWNAKYPGRQASDIHVSTLNSPFSQMASLFRPATVFDNGTQRLCEASGKRRAAFDRLGRLAFAWYGDSGKEDSKATNLTLHSTRGFPFDSSYPCKEIATRSSGHMASPYRRPSYDPNRRSSSRDSMEPRTKGKDGARSFIGITDTGWDPPDPMIAAGPDSLVVVTNGEIAFFTKEGERTYSIRLDGPRGFWREAGVESYQVIDPEVVYDPLSQRFFVLSAECDAPGDKSYALLAVSDDSNPEGTWYKYRFEMSRLAGAVFDSPNLGIDASALYVSGDAEGATGDYPVNILDKSIILSGGSPGSLRPIRLTSDYSSMGVARLSLDNPPAQYYVRHDTQSSSTSLELVAITDPFDSRQLFYQTISVPEYSTPVDPPQLGTTVRPDLFDSRFWSVLYRGGSLWAAHHVGPSPTRVRWYEIEMQGWPVSGNLPVLSQWGEIQPDENVYTFFPSLDVDAEGNMVLTFSMSSSTQYISINQAHRLSTDPPGSMRAIRELKPGYGPGTSGRWGDYSGTSMDPAEPGIVWAVHEYVPAGGGWNTWVCEYPLYSCTPSGDYNGDCLVDVEDWARFVDCFTGPEEPVLPECICFDFNTNGLVDMFDASEFQRVFAPLTPIPGCE